MVFGLAKKGLGLLGKKIPKKRSDFKLKNTLKRIQKHLIKTLKVVTRQQKKKYLTEQVLLIRNVRLLL
jgi:hypothetical protein